MKKTLKWENFINNRIFTSWYQNKGKIDFNKNLKDTDRESREKLGLWEYEKDIKISNIIPSLEYFIIYLGSLFCFFNIFPNYFLNFSNSFTYSN